MDVISNSNMWHKSAFYLQITRWYFVDTTIKARKIPTIRYEKHTLMVSLS